jgi:hypothetical protein
VVFDGGFIVRESGINIIAKKTPNTIIKPINIHKNPLHFLTSFYNCKNNAKNFTIDIKGLMAIY